MRTHTETTSNFNIGCYDNTANIALTIDPAKYSTKGASIKIEWTTVKKIYYPRFTVAYASMPANYATSTFDYDAELYIDGVLHRPTSLVYPNVINFVDTTKNVIIYVNAHIDAGKKVTIKLLYIDLHASGTPTINLVAESRVDITTGSVGSCTEETTSGKAFPT